MLSITKIIRVHVMSREMVYPEIMDALEKDIKVVRIELILVFFLVLLRILT